MSGLSAESARWAKIYADYRRFPVNSRVEREAARAKGYRDKRYPLAWYRGIIAELSRRGTNRESN